MNAPPVQYATTPDGYSIAFTVQGDGPPLVCLPFLYSHAQVVWTASSAAPLLQTLAKRFRVVYYDSRGQGLSQRGLPPDTSQDSYLLDLRAVIDKLRIQTVILLGDSFFSHIAVRFAADSPERVSALALLRCGVTLAGPIDWFRNLVRQNWDHFLSFQAGQASMVNPEASRNLERRVEGLKARTTQEDFLKLMDAFYGSDISETLASLKVPSLVLHPANQTLISQEESTRTASRLQNGRLVVLNGPNFFGDADQVLGAIERLLAEASMSSASAISGPTLNLSSREVEVLQLLAAGKSNQDIPNELVISLNTVNRHVSNIYAKTGAANRAQAAVYARDHGVV
jgi:pimeloyl-ACP methyl ester carboxylesterase/DNA-binding CsgD family transcriptional regulator